MAANTGGVDPPAASGDLDTSEFSRRLQEGALRCYPVAARRFRQTGEAKIRFCVDAAGALSQSVVAATSGSDLLDRAAIECVLPGAAPFLPGAFGHCFTLPVRFQQQR